ncbi:MAG: ArnT family glycosyltransferase [Planctomycetota bacterium]
MSTDARSAPISAASNATSGPPWTRATTLAFAAFLGALIVSTLWLVHPYFEAVNDAAIYMLCAKSMLAGDGYSYLGQPFIIRPPGFSVLIAPLVAWRGFDFQVLNAYVTLWGVAGVALLFVLFRPWLGTLCALCAATCVWLNPAYRSLSNQAMSDVPGIALLLACLLFERWARRAPSPRRDVVLGIAIGLSAYVRTVTVLLVPAIVLMRCFEHWRETRTTGSPFRMWPFVKARVLAIAALPALVLLPWSVRNHFHHPTTPVDQTSLFSYSTGMWNVDRGDPASARLSLSHVIGRAPGRFEEAFSVLGSRLRDVTRDRTTSSAPPSHVERDVALGVVLFALGLFGFARRRDPCVLFLCAVVAIVLVYFSFQDRLMLPVYVLCVPAAADLLLALASRRVAPRVARGLVATAMLALALLDFRPRAGWRELEHEHAAFEALSAELAPRLAPSDVLAAPMKGWYFSVFLDRPVYSLYFAWDRARDMRAVEALIDRYGVDTVLLSPWTDVAGKPMLPYFQARYPRFERLATGAIARVRD